MRCGYGLQVYGNTNNFNVLIGFLCEARRSHTIET